MMIEVKTLKAPSYKFLEKENLRLETKNEQLEKKIAGMQKTMDKLRLRLRALDRNLQKTLKAWSKEVNAHKECMDLEKPAEESRDKYPWMTVGC